MALGYSLVAIKARIVFFPAGFTVEELAYVQLLLTEISEQDRKIKANIDDAMAVKVQDLSLDYGQYLSQARAAGSRLLEQLATLIAVPIAHDRFKNGSASPSSGGIAVRSYY
jgi:hypothetical protein